MINLTHLGYELHYSYNLTHPKPVEAVLCKDDLDLIRWFIVGLPRYSGRVEKKDFPDEPFWKPSDEYFTYYKGRGKQNKGDRMVNFYMKAPEVTEQHLKDFMNDLAQEEEERNEPLY